MEQFWQEIVDSLPTVGGALTMVFRLALAAFVGALPGLQREHARVAAGLRTHMLVSMGAALFVMSALEGGASPADLSRVVQGLATGIGFVGAGAILKSQQENSVRGVTTAASVWLTAALGTAVGMGSVFLPVAGAAMALFVLEVLRRAEKSANASNPAHRSDQP